MRALLILMLLSSTAFAQSKKITVAIYAPSVEFGTASARVAYVQGLGKAIEQNTGLQVEAQSYANLAALKKDNVDFVILDGPCYATNLGWKLLATAAIGGATTRQYALFAAAATDMNGLKGKKLAIVATGCNDAGFIDNAMLESDVDPAHWGARVGKSDLTAALAEVSQAKTSQAVFAPVGAVKGLTKVFDTVSVPNPAFVDAGSKLPQATVDKVAAAVIGFGGGGAIGGWTKPSREIYTGFASRLGKQTKTAAMANADPVRIDAKDVLIEPPTIKDAAVVTSLRHHHVRLAAERME